MGGGRPADCGEESIGFSTPFGVVFHTIGVSIMAIHREQWVRDKFGYKKGHRTKSYGRFLSSKAILFLRKYLYKIHSFIPINKMFTLLRGKTSFRCSLPVDYMRDKCYSIVS